MKLTLNILNLHEPVILHSTVCTLVPAKSMLLIEVVLNLNLKEILIHYIVVLVAIANSHIVVHSSPSTSYY